MLPHRQLLHQGGNNPPYNRSKIKVLTTSMINRTCLRRCAYPDYKEAGRLALLTKSALPCLLNKPPCTKHHKEAGRLALLTKSALPCLLNRPPCCVVQGGLFSNKGKAI